MGMTDQEKIELLQEIVNEYRARTREVSRTAAQEATDTPESIAAEVAYFEEHADRFAAAHKGIRTSAQTTQEKFEAHDPFIKMYEQHIASAQTPAHLEELAQWADAAVELFPVHGEKFRQIAEVLRRLPPAD
jgi:hypothetical protein